MMGILEHQRTRGDFQEPRLGGASELTIGS